MPFASVFGHNTQQNFSYCISTMQKNFMGPLLKPLNFNIGLLGNITGGLTKNLDSNRSFMSGFRESMSASFMNIFGVMFNISIEVQKTIINVKDMIGKVVGIMTTLMYILNGSMMTMESTWNGPPGQLVRALCFHPDTKLQLKSGEMIEMKNIPLNSELQNGTRVCATMQISNLDENGAIVEKMYRVKRKAVTVACTSTDDILVSGSHLVYDPSIKQFVHVKDLPSSELSEVDCDVLSCLITSDHTIPIGEWIFHDWEDSNGSAPKKIGGK
jgi:hypothetical protein